MAGIRAAYSAFGCIRMHAKRAAAGDARLLNVLAWRIADVAPALDALIHRLFWVDTGVESVSQRADADVQPSAQFSQRNRLTSKVDATVHPHVVLLLLTRGPATVRWFVVAVRIHAVKRIAGWTRTHIGQECTEVVAPPVTHHDAATPVSREGMVVRVVAASFRRLPGQVLARFLATHTPDYNAVVLVGGGGWHGFTTTGEVVRA